MSMKMKSSANAAKVARSTGSALPAVLVAAAVGVTLLLQGPVSRKVASTLGNASAATVEQNGTATARFNWDVRSATSVLRASDRELVLDTSDGATVVYSFDNAAHTVTRTKGTESTTVLTGIESISFLVYEAPALFNQMKPTTPANARVVGLKWTSLCAVKATSHPQSAIATLQLASR